MLFDLVLCPLTETKIIRKNEHDEPVHLLLLNGQIVTSNQFLKIIITINIALFKVKLNIVLTLLKNFQGFLKRNTAGPRLSRLADKTLC
jgi:uncharacterized membrane protein